MKRTTHRSTKGTKLYAKRDKGGKFTDLQTHRRASAADQRQRSQAELLWVRWGVACTKGKRAGSLKIIASGRAMARGFAISLTDLHGGTWKVVRVLIPMSLPDPLRKRKERP